MPDRSVSPSGLPRPDPQAARRLPLTRREFGLVAALWALFAVFRVADQVFTAPDLPTVARWLVPQVAQAVFWTGVTPVVFAIVEWAARQQRATLVRVAIYVALGAASAAVASGIGPAVSTRQLALLPPAPPPRQPGPRPPGRPSGPRFPPFWARFGMAASLYVAVLAAALARVSALSARTEREQAAELAAQLAETRLDALRRQLDPHFLFNTHAVVASLIEPDPPGARRMLAQLSELLRVSFRDASGQEVSLAQELALVDLYLDIMRVRYEGRLDVETHVDPATREALVPSLVLQPLVENAIKHGVERRTGRGRLVIEAARDGDTLVLRVRDWGASSGVGTAAAPGSGASSIPGTSPPDAVDGVGLSNTAARLAHLYGPTAHLTLAPAQGGGTEAVVRLPLHTVPLQSSRMSDAPDD